MSARVSKKRRRSDIEGNEVVTGLEESESAETLRKPSIIRLNVGGRSFVTTRSTLLNIEDSYFSKRFSGKFDEGPMLDGEHFIDRDGECFPYILNYLRDGQNQPALPSDLQLLWRIRTEAEYFGLSGLVKDTEYIHEHEEELQNERYNEQHAIYRSTEEIANRLEKLADEIRSVSRNIPYGLPEAITKMGYNIEKALSDIAKNLPY